MYFHLHLQTDKTVIVCIQFLQQSHLLQKSNGIFMSVFLIVLPLESMAHGLFHELGSCLGGTCVGYAVVIPTNFCR